VDKEEVGMMISEFRIFPETLVLNQPIPDSTFGITVREGTRVDDLRRDDNDKITFFANQTSTLDLSNVQQDLKNMPWLSPTEVQKHKAQQPYEPPPAETTLFRWTRILLVSVGIILIVWGLIRLFFFKK
jgi:hypothetical protein